MYVLHVVLIATRWFVTHNHLSSHWTLSGKGQALGG